MVIKMKTQHEERPLVLTALVIATSIAASLMLAYGLLGQVPPPPFASTPQSKILQFWFPATNVDKSLSLNIYFTTNLAQGFVSPWQPFWGLTNNQSPTATTPPAMLSPLNESFE
jgi:hypothetical protein